MGGCASSEPCCGSAEAGCARGGPADASAGDWVRLCEVGTGLSVDRSGDCRAPSSSDSSCSPEGLSIDACVSERRNCLTQAGAAAS